MEVDWRAVEEVAKAGSGEVEDSVEEATEAAWTAEALEVVV